MRLTTDLRNIFNWKLIVATILVAILILSRTLQSVPNVSAAAAVALFGSYLFGYKRGILITLIGMLLTDLLFKGFYDAGVMIAVYMSLCIPALLATKSFKFSKFSRLNLIINVTTKSLIGSLLFFVITNLAVWMFTGMYTKDVSGVLNCYTMAIPFFRFTWLGDLAFNGVLFSSYFMIQSMVNKPVMALK